MKKTLLTLVAIAAAFYSYAQDASYNILNVNSLVKGSGASDLWGWGPAADNTLDPRPNYNTGLVPYVMNNHTGLTFSAHSYYGGIRFYNQGYPTAYSAANGATMVMSINNNKVGIGTTAPESKLHLFDGGISSNAYNQFNGNLIIQASTGARSATSGAALEFVIPANTDGSNYWGQARIVTVAGNSASGDATGKMILGTRRMFDKGTGTGNVWNYGDDIVIDGTGNVGISTSNTQGYKLAVNGSIHSKSVKVDLIGWPDFVFQKDYKLPTLTEVKNYIDMNHHLPEMPSANEVHTNGLDLGEMNRLLLKKVEELTLYLIEQKEASEQQDKRREQQINALKQQLETITSSNTKK